MVLWPTLLEMEWERGAGLGAGREESEEERMREGQNKPITLHSQTKKRTNQKQAGDK